MTHSHPAARPGEDDLSRDPLPLRGRTALVTGASRRGGIGYAVARRLAAHGASVMLHHHRPHDEEMPWGGDDLGEVIDGVRAVLGDPGARVADVGADMADPGSPARVVGAAVAEFGRLDVLVANHARNGGDASLAEVTPDMLDGHWAVDARAPILLAQAFAARHDGRPGGRVLFMTSGQIHGAMPGEVAYASAKAVLAQITPTIAAELGPRGITVNAVDPGPVQTGYIDDELLGHVLPRFPAGRVGVPADPARLLVWLATDEAEWVTGQVISSDGGFSC
ncbi:MULTISPECIES: SDR family oxidoreductase [Nocardiopsis]|uniref:3-ketoacyl-ACP reductase n=1 Tax=Nocardiopsis sinuspersici TaxID=501010 RepID=A0A1V3C6U1_9ACTN|nr:MULTISPECIES: SDR family oxidoreductase [Nocardiopsis]OOC56352.1 3-ketoacyl-ACP reductase [Nocardiopsis sinuspersici]